MSSISSGASRAACASAEKACEERPWKEFVQSTWAEVSFGRVAGASERPEEERSRSGVLGGSAEIARAVGGGGSRGVKVRAGALGRAVVVVVLGRGVAGLLAAVAVDWSFEDGV